MRRVVGVNELVIFSLLVCNLECWCCYCYWGYVCGLGDVSTLSRIVSSMGVFEVVEDIVLALLVMLLRVMLVLGIRRRPRRVRRRDICVLIPGSL